jgi:hypothetical protein
MLARFNRHGASNAAVSRKDLSRPKRGISFGLLFQHWLALDENRQTWVSVEHRRLSGLISARQEQTVWEIDRLLLGSESDPMVVRSLLSYLMAVGSEVGIQKVFLRVPQSSRITDSVRGTGFVEYNGETLFVRPLTVPRFPHVPLDGLRQKSSSDDHALFQLYCQSVPVEVREAEAMVLDEWQQLRQRNRPVVKRRELVLERDGQIVGWLQSGLRNAAGHIEVLVGAGEELCLSGLIYAGIELIGTRVPIYCLVSGHQAGLPVALEDHGFVALAESRAFVSQLAVRVRQPRLVPVQA